MFSLVRCSLTNLTRKQQLVVKQIEGVFARASHPGGRTPPVSRRRPRSETWRSLSASYSSIDWTLFARGLPVSRVDLPVLPVHWAHWARDS